MRYVVMVGLVLGLAGSAAAAELSSGGRTSMLNMGAAQLGGAQRLGGTEIQFSPPYAPSGVGQNPWLISTDDIDKAWRERAKTERGAAVETAPATGEGTGTGEGVIDTYPDERTFDERDERDDRVRDQPPNDEGAY